MLRVEENNNILTLTPTSVQFFDRYFGKDSL